MNKRFHRLGKAKLKCVSEIGDSRASFERDLAVKNWKLKKQSTSSIYSFCIDQSIQICISWRIRDEIFKTECSIQYDQVKKKKPKCIRCIVRSKPKGETKRLLLLLRLSELNSIEFIDYILCKLRSCFLTYFKVSRIFWRHCFGIRVLGAVNQMFSL